MDRLGDALEAAVLQTNRDGRIDRNRLADDFSDEVVAVTTDPDVSGLIDREDAT